MTRQRILLIDDERDLRAIAKFALEEVGSFDVFECVSGADACEQFSDFDPDIVLLDVMMPGMDGVATMAALRKLMTRRVPVIFITAKAQVSEVARFVEVGADAVVTKPFDPMTLAKDVQDIWDKFIAE